MHLKMGDEKLPGQYEDLLNQRIIGLLLFHGSVYLIQVFLKSVKIVCFTGLGIARR
jgi:hypothetical protein